MGFKENLKEILDSRGITPYRVGVETKVSKQSVMNYLSGKNTPTGNALKELSEYLGVTIDYLIDERVNNVTQSDNRHGNSFIELPNGQFLMIMPVVGVEVQAGFLDRYTDVDYLTDMPKHSIIVNEVHRGNYVAFVTRGESMDNGLSNAFQPGDIVSTRELQKIHWKDKIRFNDFPYWVIYTTQSKQPLLKQIIDHDVDNCKITCHSLNEAPEYSDFELSMNDIKALFYVIDVSRSVSNKIY